MSKLIKLITRYFTETNFLAIFLLKPAKKKYGIYEGYTHSHINKIGEDYHKKFEKFPGRRIIWQIEKEIINNFLKNKKLHVHLDFAGGTGRIAKFLENSVKEQFLLDSSLGMLNHAKKILNPNRTTFVHEDFTKVELKKKFDLITAFRFFPNAEPSLRAKAMKFIADNLKTDGYLIINNHYNFWSLPLIINRLTLRSNGFGMTHNEVKELVINNGLKICMYSSVGLFTNKEKSNFLPWTLISKLELFIHKIFPNHLLGYDVVYLISK